MEAPVFILGAPRSGTTFLHRLLNADRETFTAMTLGEIFFAPAICQKRLVEGLARLDRAFGGPLLRGYRLLWGRLFRPLETIHRLDLLDAEEDEFLMLHLWESNLQFLLVPFQEDQLRRTFFDRDVAAGDRERIMAFYRDMVKRHLYAWGRGRHFLSKNPSFAAKVVSLHETFPDARLVVPLRDPEEVLPSLLSLTRTVGTMLGLADLSGPVHNELVMELLEFCYTHPADLCPRLFPGRWREVRYQALLQDLGGEVEEIYRLLEATPGPGFRRLLEEQAAASRRYRSRHHYDLGDFDLDRQAVARRFGPLRERFGFTRS